MNYNCVKAVIEKFFEVYFCKKFVKIDDNGPWNIVTEAINLISINI